MITGKSRDGDCYSAVTMGPDCKPQGASDRIAPFEISNIAQNASGRRESTTVFMADWSVTGH